LKAKVLAVTKQARAKDAELEGLCVDVPADADGRWNAKDHLAHAAWWRERDGRLIEAVRTGSPPPPAVGSREERTQEQEEGRQNAVTYQLYRDRPLDEIREYASSTWDSFNAAVEACSEADLSKPHPYAAGEVLWQTIVGICYHTGEHLSYWYQDAGDETKLEATQRWLRDIYVAVAPDASSRANANYNLACFYARGGRAAEALPLLRDSFAHNDQLREWAKKDSDLDPIRGDAQLQELLR
jgi:hypothetical protein